MLRRILTVIILLCAIMALAALLQVGQSAAEADRIMRGLAAAVLIAMGAVFIFRPRAASPERADRFRGAKPIGAAPNLRLSDVAACEDAKAALFELCDYLRFPARYAAYGARMPRGVLLYGAPGTGKTLLARACAGEAGIPFFALSGSDFVQMYVGVGASRVRELFRKARACGRSVIFIDEIDAIGARRHEGGTDERDQTINALLTEMSGFRPCEGVIVIAATNRLEALDPALTRPGRFDRKIEVGLPDCAQRRQILAFHAKGKPLAPDVSLDMLALDTAAFSGAALESLLNAAAVRAARRDNGPITRADIDAAFLSATVGNEHPSQLDMRERRQTAIHEAGHALLTFMLEPDSKLRRLSILPTGGMLRAAGYSMSIPKERTLFTCRRLKNRLCIMLAGRAAEELIFGREGVSSGAENDIARATELAAHMITELGMNGLPVNRRMLGSNSEAQITALLETQYRAAQALLENNRSALMRMAETLAEKEALDGEALYALLDGCNIIMPPEAPADTA